MVIPGFLRTAQSLLALYASFSINKNLKLRHKQSIELFFIALLLVLCSVSPLLAGDSGHHLFILSGQSNMLGMDPRKTFVPTLVEEFGEERVIVVKHSGDGRPIRRWYKDWKPLHGNAPKASGDIYDRLLDKVRQKIRGKEIETVTFVWMQGETDAMEQFGKEYKASLVGLVEQLSSDLGREDVNVVLGRISDFDLTAGKYPHWRVVRRAQVEAAEANPYWRWVDTDLFNDGMGEEGQILVDDLHYTVEGYALLGHHFAREAIELIKLRSGSDDRSTMGTATKMP